MADYSNLYFYEGRFRTDRGLKRALIKDGYVWVSKKQNYYLWEEYFEYYYSFEYLRDTCYDYGYITDKEHEHFQAWLNKMVKEDKIKVVNHEWYHCDANDGIGTADWWDTREAVMDSMDDTRYMNEYIENAERTWEEYADTITDEEFQKFQKLSEDEQFKIAMKWRIATYNDWRVNHG